ncbi:MAG: hypothetical protein SFW08_11450, partial [Gemmatimonadaceae bacterium]|nr:hypothetical protein [Gemmatimonadaceae bacterium]
MRAAIVTLLTAIAALPAWAQSARPVPGGPPSGPINIIRPSAGAADPAADTTPTVFYTGARRPAVVAAEPRTPIPGDELVVWRSSSPIVRSV